MSFRDDPDEPAGNLQPFIDPPDNPVLKKSSVIDFSQQNLLKKSDVLDENQADSPFFTLNDRDITLWILFMNLLPNVATSVMYQGVGLIEYHFTGQLQNTDISDGVNLGQNFIYLVQYYMSSGFIEGMAFLCAKSFGSKNLYLLGIQTNQSRLLSLGFYAVMTVLTILFSLPVLNFMSGSESIVQVARSYILYMIPATFFLLNYEIYCKYAETQLIYRPKIYALILALIIHPFLCYMFIIKLNYGEIGQAICACISELCKASVMFFYFTIKNPYPESNFFFNKDTCLGFGRLFKVTFFTAVLYYFENAGGSIVGVFASNLNEIEYAKYVNLANIALISFSIGYGFLTTANIMVGNYIGSNSPKNVKKTINYISAISLITSLLWLGLLVVFPTSFTYFFSESSDVFNSPDMHFLVFLMGVSEALDIMQSTFQGCLLGLGVFHSTTVYGFLSYFVAMPGVSYLLTFTLNMGVAGCWYAPIIVYGGLTVLFGVLLLMADYEKLCQSFQKNLVAHEIVKRSLIKSIRESAAVGDVFLEKSISKKEDFI